MFFSGLRLYFNNTEKSPRHGKGVFQQNRPKAVGERIQRGATKRPVTLCGWANSLWSHVLIQHLAIDALGAAYQGLTLVVAHVSHSGGLERSC